MIQSEKLEAQEKRQDIFERDSWTCVICGKPLSDGVAQLAHGISKSKCNIKKYGESVINHPLNLFSVESLKCNSKCNIGMNPVKTNELVEKIRDAMLGE